MMFMYIMNNIEELESDVYHKWIEQLAANAKKHSKRSLRIQRKAYCMLTFCICAAASVGMVGMVRSSLQIHDPNLWYGVTSMASSLVLLFVIVESYFEKAMYQLKCAHDLERLKGECDFNLKKRIECVTIRKKIERALTTSNKLLL